MPHDWASISQFLSPLVDRIEESSGDVQLLVITPDDESAAAVAAAAVRVAADRQIRIMAATSAARASRLAKLRPPQVLAGPYSVILELVAAAALKLTATKTVCIAWIDELIARGGSAALETLMAEIPKEAARAVVTASIAPEVEALLERYARRARRVLAKTPELREPTDLSYVTVSPQSRLRALRRLLDDVNPASALVFVRDADREPAIRTLLRSLGYSEQDDVRIGRAAAPNTDLVVLFDLPATHEELREAAGTAGRTIALIQPRQLESLRALAAGGTISAYTLPESASRAREREARMRDELREVLVRSSIQRELLALEPLLDEYDGVELAAAALKLREQEREAARDRERAAAAARIADAPASISRARDAGAMTRLFVNVGVRDNVRPGDLMGTIANQAGVAGSDVGKIDIRESHSIVEVAAGVADQVIERVTGTTIRGRRAIVRRDEERPARGAARGPGRGARGPARGGRREARE